MTDMTMTCERLDELLPDYLDGALDGATRELLESHLAGCARCTALVGDLNDVRAEARALPTLRPSRDLWSGIEARIAAPVAPIVSLETRRTERRRWSASWLAAAAAALIAVSSGITYTLARRPQTEIVARSAAPSSATVAAIQPQRAPAESSLTMQARPESAATASTTEPQPARGQSRLVRNESSRAVARADAPYDHEIASLRRVVRDRERQLDPATVRELRRNLDIIDHAIAQSRAALQRDPASGFLNERLNNVLGKKVELLRTAALLPART
jgi:hypothetical protein